MQITMSSGDENKMSHNELSSLGSSWSGYDRRDFIAYLPITARSVLVPEKLDLYK